MSYLILLIVLLLILLKIEMGEIDLSNKNVAGLLRIIFYAFILALTLIAYFFTRLIELKRDPQRKITEYTNK